MDVYKKFNELNLEPWKNYIYANETKSDRKNYKIFLSSLLKFKENDKTSRPVMIRIETVNICNNNCIICTKHIAKRKEQTMSMDIFKKILQGYSKIGGGKISITPDGGDIFLDCYLIERIRLIKKYPNISGLSVTTNGVMSDLFNDEQLKEILSAFERIQISIYGLDEEEYSTMTNRNTFSRMINSVKRIVDFTNNSTELFFGFRFLKNRTPDEIDDWINNNFSRPIKYGSTICYNNWGNNKVNSNKLPFDATWLKVSENESRCVHPLIAYHIFSNGDVSYCPCADYDVDAELKLGSIENNDLSELFNSRKVLNLWDSDRPIPNYCKYCTTCKSFKNVDNLDSLIKHPSWIFGA
jgi:MoaA/NifB/PqqE/SkfB family radical SAM enzyme